MLGALGGWGAAEDSGRGCSFTRGAAEAGPEGSFEEVAQGGERAGAAEPGGLRGGAGSRGDELPVWVPRVGTAQQTVGWATSSWASAEASELACWPPLPSPP